MTLHFAHICAHIAVKWPSCAQLRAYCDNYKVCVYSRLTGRIDRYECNYAHMNIFPVLTPDELVTALGARIKARRLAMDMSQAHLADKSGVSRRALVQLEGGHGSTLHTLAHVLKALGLGNEFANLVPEPTVSPLVQLRAEKSRRRRAS